VILKKRLQAVVSKRLVIRLRIVVKDLGKSRISYNLTLVARVLEVVFLDILAQVLGNLNTRVKLIGRKTSKLGHLRANLNRLEETGIVILASRWLLLFHNTSRCGLKNLDTTSDAAQELNSRVLIGTIPKTSYLCIKEVNKL
jgi:hypothetical protein